jgi:BirA family biotin operon repressor/biotin-[acetyl-CoA-carboxylase] ligase
LVRDLKIAGILVEALPDSRLVVGVGVNISSTEASLPHSSATSLALEGVSISDTEADLLTPIAEGLVSVLALGREKDPSEAHSLWNDMVTQRLSTLGRAISWTGTDGRQQRGLAQELADDGGLIVQGLLGYDSAVIRSGDIFHIERS